MDGKASLLLSAQVLPWTPPLSFHPSLLQQRAQAPSFLWAPPREATPRPRGSGREQWARKLGRGFPGAAGHAGARELVHECVWGASLRRYGLAGLRRALPRCAGRARARARAGARLRAGASLSLPRLRAPAVAAGEAPPSRPAPFPRSRPSGLPTLRWPWPAT